MSVCNEMKLVIKKEYFTKLERMYNDAIFSRLFKDISGSVSGFSGSLKLKNIAWLQLYRSLFRLIG